MEEWQVEKQETCGIVGESYIGNPGDAFVVSPGNLHFMGSQTGKTVKQSGYQNVSYFIRSFKETYGMSPLKYRKE